MKVTSSGLIDGVFGDQYGKRGTQVNANGVPNRSIPFAIEGAPAGTQSFAFVLEDKDAYPLTGGFSWIHWLGANLMRGSVLENESATATDFVQGVNSWLSMQGGQQSAELSRFYGGMCPPDTSHLYELHVYALDTLLPVTSGFYYNELHHRMDGHILAQYTLKGLYSN